MTIKLAVNGFGRIGRLFLRIAQDSLDKDVEIVAINARANTATLAHLFKYDSTYGRFNGEVTFTDNTMTVNGKEIKIYSENDPSNLPWKELGIDIVVESTGLFTKGDKLKAHINAGAKKVIITAPAQGEDKTIVMGVNDKEYDHKLHNIVSNASCTTNCLAPFAKVIDENFGIVKGLMTTIHAYTNDQKLLDKSHKDLRRARAACESIIPTTTGAAKAVAKVLPQLEGKLNGFALRVPTVTVSITDLVCEVQKDTTVEEVNNALKKAAENELKGILEYCNEPLVSVDFRGDYNSSIIDALSTMVMGKNLVKIVAWYDNEWGYTARTIDLVNMMASYMK